MEDQGGSGMMGPGGTRGNRQLLDAETLPQVHGGLSPNSNTNDTSSGVPKTTVLPSYEEALASPRQIVIQDSYISAVYAPPYPPVYPCDHQPRPDCSFCSPQQGRCNSSRAGRVRRRRLHHSSSDLGTGRSWPKILLFSFMCMFILFTISFVFNVMLNMLEAPFFYSYSSSSPTPNK